MVLSIQLQWMVLSSFVAHFFLADNHYQIYIPLPWRLVKRVVIE